MENRTLNVKNILGVLNFFFSHKNTLICVLFRMIQGHLNTANNKKNYEKSQQKTHLSEFLVQIGSSGNSTRITVNIVHFDVVVDVISLNIQV